MIEGKLHQLCGSWLSSAITFGQMTTIQGNFSRTEKNKGQRIFLSADVVDKECDSNNKHGREPVWRHGII